MVMAAVAKNPVGFDFMIIFYSFGGVGWRKIDSLSLGKQVDSVSFVGWSSFAMLWPPTVPAAGLDAYGLVVERAHEGDGDEVDEDAGQDQLHHYPTVTRIERQSISVCAYRSLLTAS